MIEVLAGEDAFHDLQERVTDYFAMGVSDVWIVNPYTQTAFVASAKGFTEPADGVLRIAGTEIHVPLADLWAELDQ